MKAAKIVVYVLIVILFIGLVSGLVLFLDNGQSNYYLAYGNRQISRKATDIELPKNAYSMFKVKSVLSSKNSVSFDDYEVNIYLDKDNVPDIGYTVDGIKYGLHGEIDFSQAFTVNKQDDYFMLYIPANYSLPQILQACYPDKTIVVDEYIPLWKKDCFQIVVTFLSENKTIAVSFH